MELREVPEPTPQEGELKVKVMAAGICGGDISAMMDLRECFMPVALGHEYVGGGTETWGDAGDFRVGDWVVTLPACYSCGECEFCRRGEVTLCKKRRSIGSHKNGAMAEYVWSFLPNTALKYLRTWRTGWPAPPSSRWPARGAALRAH